MTHHSQPGGVASPCAARSAARAGWGPCAAPASPPSPVLNPTVLALLTRRGVRFALTFESDMVAGDGTAQLLFMTEKARAQS
jgi:hypothetical protein